MFVIVATDTNAQFIIQKQMLKHKFTTESVYSGTCGDHYCPGHYHTIITCTCKWKKEISYDINSEDLEKVMLEHRLEILERKHERKSEKTVARTHSKCESE